MAYRKITAAEGAAMINDGENIGFSGFTIFIVQPQVEVWGITLGNLPWPIER